MSHIIFITIAILIVCLASTSWYIRLRFDKTPKEDKWYDNIVYIFCPLLTTCIGVLFALWIDRNEADIRQREATVKTLKLCQLDANNALDLIKRHDSLSQELYTADYILRVRSTIESFGMPYPKVIEQLLFSENSLLNCSTAYLETILRELNKLNQLKAMLDEVDNDLDFAHCINSCTIALEEIYGLTKNEILYIEGKLSQAEHDHEIDVVMDGTLRKRKLAEQRSLYEKALNK